MIAKSFLIFLACFSFLTINHAQTFQNLQFEEQCQDTKTKLCHWEVSWNYKTKTCGLAKTDQGNVLLLHNEEEDGIGYVEQKVAVNSSHLKLITFSGQIKTENVTGKGAGVTINTLDKNNNYLFVNDLEADGQDMFKGTKDRQTFSIQIILSPSTTTLRIGGILYGSGKVWFDNFKIEIKDLEQNQPNSIAKEYLDHFCNIVGTHSLRKDSIDLKSLKEQGLKIAGQATEYKDCHLAVRYIISQLGDHHSFLMTPETYSEWETPNEEEKVVPLPQHRLIKKFGYLSLPGFHSGDKKAMLDYVDHIQVPLKQFDDLNIEGWIIDLRPNNGGNMEPMLAGLGPLFSAKKVGYLVDVNGKKEAWGYKKNAAFSGKYRGVTASNPVRLKNKNLPIAVLTGPQTGSSGEIVVISFIGNKNTRSFGKPTFGVSTGNGTFKLLDEARVFLTSTIMADRNGKLYGGKITPDHWIKTKNLEQEDLELQEAIKWLEGFKGLRNK